MAAKYWGVIDDFNEYHQRRPQFGDSTDASAQVRTLKSFGLQAYFVMIGSVEKLKQQIDLGHPTPVGYLHRGLHNHHLVEVTTAFASATTSTGFWMNDPYGSCDLVNGGFAEQGGTSGKLVHYSYKNWVPRWSVAGDSDGWGIAIAGPSKM